MKKQVKKDICAPEIQVEQPLKEHEMPAGGYGQKFSKPLYYSQKQCVKYRHTARPNGFY